MRALAAKRYDEAAAALRAPARRTTRRAGEPWTAARLEQEMAPYFAAHATLSVTPLARRPSNTLIQELGTRRWRAQQRLIDPGGRRGLGDRLRRRPVGHETPGAGAPLIQLQRIGV